MANRFRSFIESILYSGMQPGVRKSPDAAAVSAPDPSDPPPRTQKARRLLLIAVPLLVVVALAVLAIDIYASKTRNADKELTSAELVARVLPNFNKGIRLQTNYDLEVVEVHFDHAASSLILGSIQNKTDHLIREAVVVFDMFDESGSQLGGITISETNLAPRAIRKFQRPIEQRNAVAAIVREVRAQ